jgi:histidinol dehydrogenase
MKVLKNKSLAELELACQRPVMSDEQIYPVIDEIFNEVRIKKDKALKKYTHFFDNVDLENLVVSKNEILSASERVSEELKSAINKAKENIEIFHASQLSDKKIVETAPGVNCWQENRPIERVGIYIPGGTAPLFSTVLMLAVPAKIAGCKEVVLCSPPDKSGKINDVILYTAMLTGVDKIYTLGGAQAIAAMTFGTESIPNVYKIFGPGNQYVTAAKTRAQQFGVAIDMPAGPSELMVVADKTSVPAFVASDLLSQAEHGSDSQVICLVNDESLIEDIQAEISDQLDLLPRKEIAQKALDNSKLILIEDEELMIQLLNAYGPEHLIIATEDPIRIASKVMNAGSVFIGNYTPESAGDYASGTNHTLPTSGFAKAFSGVNLDAFIKKITFQEISKSGIQKLGPAIEIMAEAELLQAHKNAVTLRLKAIQNEN